MEHYLTSSSCSLLSVTQRCFIHLWLGLILIWFRLREMKQTESNLSKKKKKKKKKKADLFSWLMLTPAWFIPVLPPTKSAFNSDSLYAGGQVKQEPNVDWNRILCCVCVCVHVNHTAQTRSISFYKADSYTQRAECFPALCWKRKSQRGVWHQRLIF